MNVETGEVVTGEQMSQMLRDHPEQMIELPHMPNKDCKTCGGRGSLKGVGTVTKFIKCPQCYPA